jgi:hypothetical protein
MPIIARTNLTLTVFFLILISSVGVHSLGILLPLEAIPLEISLLILLLTSFYTSHLREKFVASVNWMPFLLTIDAHHSFAFLLSFVVHPFLKGKHGLHELGENENFFGLVISKVLEIWFI